MAVIPEEYKDVPLLEILVDGHPILRRKSAPVKRIGRKTRRLIDRMIATMYAADGVGLAAPQVGVNERIVVIDVGEGLHVLINPEILSREGEERGFEGCLSVPGYVGEVVRAKRVRVQALDRKGRPIWLDAEDLFARCIQHEIDHLDGILYTDRAERVMEVPPETRLKIVFMGTPEFAVPILELLDKAGCTPVAVVTRPDRPRGRGLATRPSPVKEAAERLEIPVLQPSSCSDPAFLEALRELAPDVIVTAAYGQILPEELLAIPRLAAVNVHASLLPRHRGAAPIQRAIWAGDTETGVTIQHMAPRLDAGDVILQERVAIGPRDDAGALHDRLARLGGRALLKALRQLATGEAGREAQDESVATYAAKLRPEEEAIDWSQPAEVVERQIRALSPRPGAVALWRGERCKVLAARLATPEEWAAAAPCEPGGEEGPAAEGGPVVERALPGRVLGTVHGEGPLVACGEGGLVLLRLQPAGRGTIGGADFLNGFRPVVGEVFGSPRERLSVEAR